MLRLGSPGGQAFAPDRALQKRFGCESLGELQSLHEVASGKEQAGAWRRVASKRRVRRVLSSNHSTHSRQEMPNWRVMPCLVKQVGTGFSVQSRCLAAQGVDRQPTRGVSQDQNFFHPVLMT